MLTQAILTLTCAKRWHGENALLAFAMLSRSVFIACLQITGIKTDIATFDNTVSLLSDVESFGILNLSWIGATGCNESDGPTDARVESPDHVQLSVCRLDQNSTLHTDFTV